MGREGWAAFERRCAVDREDAQATNIEQAKHTLAVPLLSKVWDYLKNYQVLGNIATVRQGLEWKLPLIDKDGKETGNRAKYISKAEKPGFARGIPPRAAPFHSFGSPPTEIH